MDRREFVLTLAGATLAPQLLSARPGAPPFAGRGWSEDPRYLRAIITEVRLDGFQATILPAGSDAVTVAEVHGNVPFGIEFGDIVQIDVRPPPPPLHLDGLFAKVETICGASP